ncbi:hypothetical protein [Parasulfitobacter algicola]|uniref:Uncharacterized protein n=1 Tax=Parasulfitobacter algicola TaxID=2614809 RepID=A0ABX2IKJ2_9RHOB|nr:hypothetical protein [Sulfitobacter algicola]NSX53402.1 hypothetical protein [Sulfitobacter algicola]
MQDGQFPPSPTEIIAALDTPNTEREYYRSEDCDVGATCGGQGLFIPLSKMG